MHEGKPRPGRPPEAMIPTMVANVEIFANKDRRVTLQEVANEFSIGEALADQILHEKIGMSKVSAKLAPKQLTEDQKTSWETIAKVHLGCYNHDGNKFLNCIVTADEMWVHYTEPETKAQSKQWKKAGSPHPKKFKRSPSATSFEKKNENLKKVASHSSEKIKAPQAQYPATAIMCLCIKDIVAKMSGKKMTGVGGGVGVGGGGGGGDR